MENTTELISFGINQIETKQFAIISEAHKVGEPTQVQHELKFGLDKANKRIFVSKLARFIHPNSTPFLIIEVACHFFVVEQDWAKLQVPDSDKIVLPKDFGVHLAMLTVGTLRGVLHAKTENTPFNQYIFPPFDVTSLPPELITFE